MNLTTPISKEVIRKLNIEDKVTISGVIYAARDAAHKKMIETLDKGLELPFDIRGQLIYYMGPCPSPPGKVIGSCGPTTSGRMDKYVPRLQELGLAGSIGKGYRSEEVKNSIQENSCIYLLATGGAAALIAKHVKSAEPIAYEELGPEAIWKLDILDFPAIVGIDSKGNDIYMR